MKVLKRIGGKASFTSQDMEKFDFIPRFSKNRNHSFRTLASLYKGNYGKLSGSSFLYFIKHLPTLLLPAVTANIINAATYGVGNSMRVIILNVIFMLVLLIIHVPTNYFHTKLYSRAIRFVEAALRNSITRKLQQLSISYHNLMQSGRLLSKVMRDVEAIQTLSHQLFINIVNVIMSLAIAIGFTLSKSVTVFLFFVATVPVAAAVMFYFKKDIKTRNREFRQEMELTSAKVVEMIDLVPITRAHALEDYEIARISNQLVETAEKGYRLDIIQSLFGDISWTVFMVFQVICLGFTGLLAYRGSIMVGDIAMYQSYFSTIVSQILAITNLLPIISKGLESVTSIGDVLLEENVEDSKHKRKLKDVDGNFEFKNVGFSYMGSDTPVLSDFTLSVKSGETIAFVGESGAGKTTLLNLIIGYMYPSKGKILIDGNDITDINLQSYRKHIAVVPQNSILFTGTIKDNITYGRANVSDEELKEVIEDANLTELIESLPDGWDTPITEHGNNLSGGQRQRVSIARALIRNPKIIILDEATSALDTVSERKIQSALENLKDGRTTFIVAHRLSTIKNADRIAVISEGVCREIGNYDELMAKRGLFYHMQNVQNADA